MKLQLPIAIEASQIAASAKQCFLEIIDELYDKEAVMFKYLS